MSGPSKDQVNYGLQFPEIVMPREGIFTDVDKREVLIEEVMNAEVIPIKQSLSDLCKYKEFHAGVGKHAPDSANAFRRGRTIFNVELFDILPGEKYDLHSIVYIKMHQ